MYIYIYPRKYRPKNIHIQWPFHKLRVNWFIARRLLFHNLSQKVLNRCIKLREDSKTSQNNSEIKR